MQNYFLEYQDGATVLEAYVSMPAGQQQKLPAVLICHAWSGRSQFECDKADELAALGYIGIAIDNYGKGIHGETNEENSALMQPFIKDRSKLRERLTAGLTAVRGIEQVDITRVAAIGFCFGGLCALDLARSGAELAGVVSFHGLFNAPDHPTGKPIKAKILALHGNDDPMVPPAKVLELEQELTTAGADWQIHVYGKTMHAFTNPAANAPAQGMSYNPVAAARSWTSMQNFLREIFV
ncbi:MAG: dienelactone hydrolase family protein [Pseudomonadota bacterium]